MTKPVVEVEGDDIQEEIVKEIPPAPTNIPFKKLNKLNDEEKKQIIDHLKAGNKSEHYELKELKNGKFGITYKKPPSFVEKAVANTKSKDKTDPDKIYLTNDQLMNQRIIELEVKYAKLEGKYKKQKKRVNDIYENIEEDVVIPQQAYAASEVQAEPPKDVHVASDSQPHSQYAPPRALTLRALRFKRY